PRKHSVEYRLQPFLPPSHWWIWRTAMLKKDKLAPWPQDTSHASYGLHDARNGAERKGAHHRINRACLQGDALPWEVQKLDVQLRSTPLLFRDADHPLVGF